MENIAAVMKQAADAADKAVVADIATQAAMETANAAKTAAETAQSTANGIIYVIAFAFIVLDFVTGLVKALATNSFTSTKMREGLFHKVGLILCMILGGLVDFAQRYLELGISLPVAEAICIYICLMEITSIIENVCKINPQIVPDKLTALFGGRKKSSGMKSRGD